MRKKCFSILLVILLTALGCTKPNKVNSSELIFKGEGVYWKAELIDSFEETNKTNDTRKRYILTYKGLDAKNVKRVKYSFKTNLTESSGTTSINKYKSIQHSTSGMPMRETDIINVSIEWNDKKEIFKMSTNNH